MPRMMAGLFALGLASCGSENAIGPPGLPAQPSENPIKLDNPSRTDAIIQASPPVVDVLWVIDNSCSMSCIVSCHNGTITDNVTANFPVFMQYFKGSGIDYHIGVITTDMDNPSDQGKLQMGLGHKWVDTTVTNDILAFTAMATQGTSGSGNEEGIGATYASYEEQGSAFNAGFYRDGSALHTIVLANEPDHTPAAYIQIDEFVDWYDELRTPDKRTFNSIVCVNGRSEACPEQNGRDYMTVSQQIGGIIWDIEDERWGRLLDSLGAQSAGLSAEYYLTQVPVEGTLVVTVDDADTGNYIEFDVVPFDSTDIGYLYTKSRNSVLFVNYLPPAGSTVNITYELEASRFQGQPE